MYCIWLSLNNKQVPYQIINYGEGNETFHNKETFYDQILSVYVVLVVRVSFSEEDSDCSIKETFTFPPGGGGGVKRRQKLGVVK